MALDSLLSSSSDDKPLYFSTAEAAKQEAKEEANNPLWATIKSQLRNIFTPKDHAHASEVFHRNLMGLKVFFILLIIVASAVNVLKYKSVQNKNKILKKGMFWFECIVMALSVMVPTLMLTYLRDKEWYKGYQSGTTSAWQPWKKAIVLGGVFFVLNIFFELSGLYATYYEAENEKRVDHNRVEKLYDLLLKVKADPRIVDVVGKIRDTPVDQSEKEHIEQIDTWVELSKSEQPPTAQPDKDTQFAQQNKDTLIFVQAVLAPDQAETTPNRRAITSLTYSVDIILLIFVVLVVVNMLMSMIVARDMSTDYNFNLQGKKSFVMVGEALLFGIIAAVPLFLVAKNRSGKVSSGTAAEFGLFAAKFIILFLGLQLSGTLTHWFGSKDPDNVLVWKNSGPVITLTLIAVSLIGGMVMVLKKESAHEKKK